MVPPTSALHQHVLGTRAQSSRDSFLWLHLRTRLSRAVILRALEKGGMRIVNSTPA